MTFTWAHTPTAQETPKDNNFFSSSRIGSVLVEEELDDQFDDTSEDTDLLYLSCHQFRSEENESMIFSSVTILGASYSCCVVVFIEAG